MVTLIIGFEKNSGRKTGRPNVFYKETMSNFQWPNYINVNHLLRQGVDEENKG